MFKNRNHNAFHVIKNDFLKAMDLFHFDFAYLILFVVVLLSLLLSLCKTVILFFLSIEAIWSINPPIIMLFLRCTTCLQRTNQ